MSREEHEDSLYSIGRGAILKAIQEFDRLGRRKFLETYGFGKAREYFLEHEGRLYDSKAIVGVAYKYQHPDKGALRACDFSGGKHTVARLLKSLSFDVRKVDGEA